LLVISPIHNEAAHVRRLVASVTSQTRRPDLWLVADDGSTDGTPRLLRELEASVPFMEVVAVPQGLTGRDRLAVALEARAFNWALRQADLGAFDFVGKLDGDIELSPEHFQRLLAEFDRQPTLGIAGATLAEFSRGEWRRMVTPREHVHGAVKLYSRDCFAAIGGIREQLGWDIVDGASARMRGFSTVSLPDLVARHHRPIGSAQGTLRGQARIGESAWIAHYPVHWIVLRALKMAVRRPRGLSGVAFALGYARAAVRGVGQVEDPELRAYLRYELRQRLRRPFGGLTRVGRLLRRW